MDNADDRDSEFEVEQKFRVDDFALVESSLAALGAIPRQAERQIDEYFSHPVRDFAQTDEAFRLRRVGDRNWVTYKGPKIDRSTKTRREIDIELPTGSVTAARFRALYEALGFRPFIKVIKHRREWQLHCRETRTTIALDHVDEVGLFVELEQCVDKTGLGAARQHLAELAAKLGLDTKANERRSYLELLLAGRSRP